MLHITVHHGHSFIGKYSFTEDDVITVGRAIGNDLVLADATRKVSRYHAAFIRAANCPNRYFVRDLGSRYSLRVNGRPTERLLVSDDDVIELADYRLIVEKASGRPSTPALLRIVDRRTGRVAFEESTVGLSDLGSCTQFSATKTIKEVLEQVRQTVGRDVDLQKFASTIVQALCSATGSDRGFLRLFNAQPNQELDVGIFGFQFEQAIEISDSSYLQALLERRPVAEQTVVLIPIVEKDRTAGFISLERVFSFQPFDSEEVKSLCIVGRTLGSVVARSLANPFQSAARDDCRWPEGLIGNSKRMRDVRRQIAQAASNDMNVLILGATGTGKELVARGIHDASKRPGTFVAQNVGQTTESLAESTIFGYAPKSGIAGADPKGAPGWFELANAGTLFLDEIQRLSLAMQDKFLRVLQDKEVRRIGSTAPKKVDVKILAATDCDIDAAIQQGIIRQAFYFRFGQMIRVPLLRERPEDIPLLAYHFLDNVKDGANSGSPRSISHRAMECLLRYQWPGNVRELEHCIANAAMQAGEVLFSWNLPQHVEAGSSSNPRRNVTSLEQVEREKILEALEETRGNMTRAAKILRISRMTILHKMDKYQIPRGYGDPAAEMPGKSGSVSNE